MKKTTFTRNVKNNIIPPYKSTNVNGPSIYELHRRHFRNCCQIKNYFKGLNKLSRIQKFCEIFTFCTVCLTVWFILGCWGLLCENVFYENRNFKELFIFKVVIALITCIIHQMINGSIIFLVFCINESIKRNRKIGSEEGVNNYLNPCNLILYFITGLLILVMYALCTYMEFYFQRVYTDEEFPGVFTNKSIPYTLCGLLKPMPILFLSGYEVFFEESKDQLSSEKNNKKRKRSKIAVDEEGYNSV